MKTSKFSLKIATFCATAMLIAPLASNATTIPSKITAFTPEKPTSVLQARPKGWRDPAFGNQGWTHSSAWGKFSAKAGQTIKIKAKVNNPDIHPGISVWHRGKDDTAPNRYVQDHFYAQNANQFVFGAKDETTGEDVGNIVMEIAYFGYDQDNNDKQVKILNGIVDGNPGEVELEFIADQSGAYMFVLGGFNPAASIDASKTYKFQTTVLVNE